MRKTLLLLIIALLFATFFSQGVSAENEINIMLDEEKIELKTPYTFIANRTMVTIDSGLFEKLGAKADYDKNNGKILIDGDYSTVELTVNESVAYIYRKFDFTGIPLTVEMDVAPFIETTLFISPPVAVEGWCASDWDGV